MVESWIKRDKEVYAKSYRFPSLVITKSEGINLTDIDGKSYLDFTSGGHTCNLGHKPEAVISAVLQQIDQTGLSSIGWTLNPTRIKFAEKLLEVAPGSLSKGRIGLCNTGSDATELVLRLARQYTKKPLALCFFGCFHGQTTLGSLALNTSPHGRKYGVPSIPDIMYVPFPYCYRCPFGKEKSSCNFECIDFIEFQFETRVIPPEYVGVLFIELIQVHGGVIPLPEGYLERLTTLCKQEGILIAVDEVTTGFGRTGRIFALEYWDVDVDILYMAKSIASGLSLGAIIATQEIMENFVGGGTYSGNPVACAASHATISSIQDNGILKNVQKMGEYLEMKLRELSTTHSIIGDVRGRGLLYGVELVERGKQPARDQTRNIIDEMVTKGLLMFPAGVYQNVLRLCPPLIIQKEDIDKSIEILQDVLPK
ncbi:MAG: aspartate aminotransferase family protein [Candidatus Hodarchaeales archaeon]